MLRFALGILLIAYGSAFGGSYDARAQVQAPNIQWEKCYGGSDNDQGECIIRTSDGGYAIACFSNSKDGDVLGLHGNAGGDFDFWVVKLDDTGAIQWQKCLGGSHSDEAYSIIQTTDGGFVVVGFTWSNDGDVSGYHGTDTTKTDAWVVRLNDTGAILWQKVLGGLGVDGALSVTQTTDGGFAIAGKENSVDGLFSTNHGSYDFFVAKLDANGGFMWQRSLGGSGDDEASSIVQTFDGGLAVAGVTRSNDGDVSGNHGGADAWVVKLNDTGAIQWQKCIGGSSSDFALSIIQTADSGLVFAGVSNSVDGDVQGNHGGDDAWVVKLSKSGIFQWQKCLGGPKEDQANAIAYTADKGFIIAGFAGGDGGDVSGWHPGSVPYAYQASDYWVVKLDSNGVLQWQKCLGGSNEDVANSVVIGKDGGPAVLGITQSNDSEVTGNHGQIDAWLVKLSPPPTVAYITPDAGAPGMCVAVEIVAPIGSTGDFGTDGLDILMGGRDSEVQLVNKSDTSLVKVGPGIVSWNGRMIQQMLFIEPSVPKLDTSIQLEVVVNGEASLPFTFHILAPRHVGTLTSGTVIGQNIRTARNTLVVDSMILSGGSYTLPTTDPDPSTAGNQGYLPLRILSMGPIQLTNATLSVNGSPGVTGTGGGNGGPGGGGGGSGYPGAGGAGYSGGGGDDDNSSGPGGTGSGSVTGSSAWTGGSGLSGVTGANGEQHTSGGGDDGGGGGTGHPFGSSGTNGTNTSSPAGGYGGASAGGSTSSYLTNYGGGGGGNEAPGGNGGGPGANAGQAVGNSMLIPFFGGSGGGAGNSTHITTEEGGSGGGGGGAIELTSFASFSLQSGAITANGGNGSNGQDGIESAAGGGGGSGGAISIGARDSIVIGTTASMSENGGSAGSGQNSGASGGLGRVRIDGYVSKLSGDASSANYFSAGHGYTGPSIQKVTFGKNNDSIMVSGHGASWDGTVEPDSVVSFFMTFSSLHGGWFLTNANVLVDPASHTSSWNVSVPWTPLGPPGPADSEIYLLAYQTSQVANGYVNGTSFVDTPSYIMGHTSGMIVKVPAVPKALVKIDTVNFGDVTVGQCSDDTTFEVYSVGGANLIINSIVLTGAGASQYDVITSTPITINPGDSAAIELKFCPTTKACPIPATLAVNTNDTLKIVQLTGCGIEPEASIHPLLINFGLVHVGDCKDTTVTLVNPGTDELTVTSEDLVDGTDFTILDATPFTLAAGDSIPLHLSYCPKDTSTVSTIDTVLSNAPQSPILVTLTGGGKIGILSIPPVLDFGLVHEDSCKDSGFYAVNTGNDSLLVTSNQITASNFTKLAPSTPFVIQPQDSVFVIVQFCSTDTGSFSALDTLISDIPSGPSIQLLALTGIGILSIPNTIDFGSVPTGGCKDSVVAISNIGTDTLVLDTNNTFLAPFSFVGPNPLRLAPGEKTTIDLRFCPTDTNSASENVQFGTLGSGTSPQFTLLGKGTEGVLATSGAIDLGCIDSSTTWSVTLRNTGSAPLTNLTPIILPNGAATIVHQPPATLAAGASDSVVLIVIGSVPGNVSATLSFSWTGGGPINLPISAQVSVQPKIISLDTVIAFDTTGVGDSSINECVGITNYSCIALPLDSVTISSGIPGEFEIVSNNAGKSISDSEVATICIRYKPQRGGPSLGQLLVKSGSDTVQIATLTGNGKGTSLGVRLAIDTIAGRPGDIVDVPVRTLNDVTSAAITSLTFRVTFDPMQLDLKAPVSPFSIAPQSGGNVKDVVPPPNPISATYTVKQYSIGDKEITATYSQPLTGMPIVAELPFEILLPTANTANIHLESATFGTSLATLSSENDGLIEIEQCDTNEHIALQVNPVDVAPVNPNPFSDRAQVAVQVNTAGHIRMEVFNALGELVRTNFDADVPTGAFAIDIDATGLSSGAYRCVTTWTGPGQSVRDEKVVVVMR